MIVKMFSPRIGYLKHTKLKSKKLHKLHMLVPRSVTAFRRCVTAFRLCCYFQTFFVCQGFQMPSTNMYARKTSLLQPFLGFHVFYRYKIDESFHAF